MIRRRLHSAAVVAALALPVLLPAIARADSLPSSRERLERFLRLDGRALRAPAPSAFAGAGTAVAPMGSLRSGSIAAGLEHASRAPSVRTTVFHGSLPAKGAAPPRLDGIFYDTKPIDIASAGDVDGNGTTDYIVSYPDETAGGLASAGRVVVVRRTTSSSTSLEIPGTVAFANFGASVASAGD